MLVSKYRRQFGTASSRRFKDEIEPMDRASEAILLLTLQTALNVFSQARGDITARRNLDSLPRK